MLNGAVTKLPPSVGYETQRVHGEGAAVYITAQHGERVDRPSLSLAATVHRNRTAFTEYAEGTVQNRASREAV